MQIKLIKCSVLAAQKALFARAQLAWAATAECPGFLGQCGGWDKQSGDAIVLSSWKGAHSLSPILQADPVKNGGISLQLMGLRSAVRDKADADSLSNQLIA